MALKYLPQVTLCASSLREWFAKDNKPWNNKQEHMVHYWTMRQNIVPTPEAITMLDGSSTILVKSENAITTPARITIRQLIWKVAARALHKRVHPTRLARVTKRSQPKNIKVCLQFVKTKIETVPQRVTSAQARRSYRTSIVGRWHHRPFTMSTLANSVLERRAELRKRETNWLWECNLEANKVATKTPSIQSLIPNTDLEDGITIGQRKEMCQWKVTKNSASSPS